MVIRIQPQMSIYFASFDHLLDFVFLISVIIKGGQNTVDLFFLDLAHMLVKHTEAAKVKIPFLLRVLELRADEARSIQSYI